MELSEYLFFGSVPIIVGLVSAIKLILKNKRYYPVISMGFGVGLNMLVGYELGKSLIVSFVMGIIAGLTASGLWTGAKNVVKKAKK